MYKNCTSACVCVRVLVGALCLAPRAAASVICARSLLRPSDRTVAEDKMPTMSRACIATSPSRVGRTPPLRLCVPGCVNKSMPVRYRAYPSPASEELAVTCAYQVCHWSTWSFPHTSRPLTTAFRCEPTLCLGCTSLIVRARASHRSTS